MKVQMMHLHDICFLVGFLCRRCTTTTVKFPDMRFHSRTQAIDNSFFLSLSELWLNQKEKQWQISWDFAAVAS